MSTATRTEAEANRAKQLTTPLSTRDTRRAYTCSSENLTKLDLSCLPVETKFTLAKIEMSGFSPDFLDEDEANVIMECDMRSAQGTLRQVSWTRQGHGATQWLGLEVRMPKSRAGSSKSYVELQANGASSSMRAMYCLEVLGKSSPDIGGLRGYMTNKPIKRLVMPQHLLRFPATYYGRDDVSFLGLPQGTIVPLKNGGKFRVNCRTNVTVEADGAATGHLHLIPLDDKARMLGLSMGWASENIMGSLGYLVPPNLYTGKTGGRNFDIEGIRCPYVDPTIGMESVFAAGLPHEFDFDIDEVKAAVSKGKKAVWAATPEELATQLDDFLFG